MSKIVSNFLKMTKKSIIVKKLSKILKWQTMFEHVKRVQKCAYMIYEWPLRNDQER